MVCVGNDDDVRAVVHGDDGVLATMADGSILVDHTTTSAELAREVAAACAERGVGFVDAPVSGGQAGAEAGRLTVMCGADSEAVFERARPRHRCLRREVRADGTCRRRPADEDGQPDLHRRRRAGPRRSRRLHAAGRPRPGPGVRRHRQGRRPELADGQPGGDDGGRRVRLRVRRGVDAQGPRVLPRRGPTDSAAGCPSPRSSTSSTPRSTQRGGKRWDTSSLVQLLREP